LSLPPPLRSLQTKHQKKKPPRPALLKKNSDQGTAGLYVQIALFAQPENTAKTVSKLTKIGLPIQTRQVTLNEKRFTNVVAGPFTQRADANEALSTIQQQGFKDAYLR
jgi:cell division septation protein DedD